MTPASRSVRFASLLLASAAAWNLPAAAQQQWNEPLPPPVLAEPEPAEPPTEAEILEAVQELQQAIEEESEAQAQQPNEPLPQPVEQEVEAQHNDPIPPPALEDGEDDQQGRETLQQEQQ